MKSFILEVDDGDLTPAEAKRLDRLIVEALSGAGLEVYELTEQGEQKREPTK